MLSTPHDYDDSTAPEAIEYQFRSEGRRPLAVTTTTVLVLTLAGFSFLAPFLISLCESMFKDLGQQLPSLALTLSRIPDFVWITCGVVGVVAIVAKDRIVSPDVALVINAVILLVGAVFVAAVVADLFVSSRSPSGA